MKILSVPVCEHCKQGILSKGVIFWGNVNVVDVSAPDGDGGGIVGDNFPSGALHRETFSFCLKDVKKSAFHLECFATMAAAALVEVWI